MVGEAIGILKNSATDHKSVEFWIFFINIPFGILTVLLAQKYIEDPPYARKQKNVHTDYLGIFFLVAFL